MRQELNAIPVIGWCERPLKDLGRLIGGGTPSRSQPSYWNGQIPWASVKDFSNHAVFLTDTAEQISHEGLASSASTLVPENTPVICTRMAVGRCALTAQPTAINQDLKALLLTKDVDRRFFIRLLRYHGPTLDRVSIGSTVRGITLGDLLSLKLSYPEAKQEQSRIAAVLDVVDEVIAKTEAVIAKLKQVRAGLLHDLLTRGLDENGQLRDPVAHPEQFQDSPIGRIPKEWEICLLDDVAARGSGHTPSKDVPSYWNGGVKWVSLADSDKLDRIYISETDKEISDLGIENSSAVKHPLGTVILSRDAGVGKSAILVEEMAVSQHFIAWYCSKRLHNLFLYYWLQHNKPRFEAIAMGSTIKTIGLPFFKLLEIAVPPRAEQDTTSEILLGLESTLSKNEQELAKLRHLKSALMADLLTGRVRVPADIFQEHS